MKTSNILWRAVWVLVLAFVSAQAAMASAKAGEATVQEGYTVTIRLADPYVRTLQQSSGITHQWYSENTSQVSVVSSSRYQATVRGVRPTSACRVYFKCSYFIDGFYRTMDFYYDIEVLAANVSVTRVELNRSSASLKEGNTLQLSAAVYPTNATNRHVNWTSSRSAVATVSSYGLVTAQAPGTATITCRAADGSGAYATCVVTVSPADVPVSLIALSQTQAELNEGETLQLSASVSPSTATDKSVSWTSGNAAVASVSTTGRVTALSPGTATITCRAKDGSGVSAACQVTVKEPVMPSAVSLNRSKATLTAGQTLQLAATVSPSDATDQSLTWMSDNTAVATVSPNGLVTALSSGEANIVVTTANHLAAVCALTVEEPATGEPTEWQGEYIVSGQHVENAPTQTYADRFEMTIERKEDACFITSLFGNDLTAYNPGGFRLRDNGDGTATVDISEYNVLKYTDNDSPLYALYVYDEAAEDFANEWVLRMNDDGTVEMGDFCVLAFRWTGEGDRWADAQVEALYYNLLAKEKTASGLSEAQQQGPSLKVCNGTILLNEVADVKVYRTNGTLAFAGKTQAVRGLEKGIYIVRTAGFAQKVQVK